MRQQRSKGLIILGCLLFLFSGCYDYHEVEDVSLVSGIGVEYVNEEMVVHLELIEKGRIASAGEGIKVITTKGKSFAEACSNIVLQSGKRPYFGHAQLLFLDESVAPYFRDIVRDFISMKDIRYDMQLVFVKNGMDAIFGKQGVLRAFDLYELMKTNQAEATSLTLRLVDYVAQKDTGFLMPVLTSFDEEPTLVKGAQVFFNMKNEKVDEEFVSSYLMLESRFESRRYELQNGSGELRNVKVYYQSRKDRLQIVLKGTFIIQQEDLSHKMKNEIRQIVTDEIQHFILENKRVNVVDFKTKFMAQELFEKKVEIDQIDVLVDIDVLDASDHRRS